MASVNLRKMGVELKYEDYSPIKLSLSFRINDAHRDNPSLVFKNPLQQETHGLLILFQK